MKYLVGVGASAGGLDALSKFFKHMPIRSDTAFVVIQHLSPDYKSLMNELLAKYTDMPLKIVEDDTLVEAGKIYLIPPKFEMTIEENRLQLNPFDEGSRLNTPIDTFFASLADDYGAHSIAVILSGTGSDGTRGMRNIKDAGGLIITQDEFSAQFDGMPKSAIYTGLVDYILEPEKMGDAISVYIDNRIQVADSQGSLMYSESLNDDMMSIYRAISKQIGLDLSYYKQNTVRRRIERRMSINHISKLSDYTQLLRNDKGELSSLCNELLIGVTRFFRDNESFDVFYDEVLPNIFRHANDRDTVRLWIAGCSTGEEVYSYNILVKEYLAKYNLDVQVKIFASDIDKNSIEFASAGIYPKSIANDIPLPYINTYFEDMGEFYGVSKEIRENIVFTVHNIIEDPPFNKMDFISCRNLLIYFQPVLQKKVLSYFDYALNEGGYLVLGPSETLGNMDRFYDTVSTRWKVFRHLRSSKLMASDIGLSTLSSINKSVRSQQVELEKDAGSAHNSHLYRMLISSYMDPMVIVDSDHNVNMVVGGANRYLRIPDGLPTYKVTDMFESDSAIYLNAALRRAFNDAKSTQFTMQKGEDKLAVNVSLVDNKKLFKSYAVISFVEAENRMPVSHLADTNLDQDVKNRIEELEVELQFSKENLQAANEELETSNEELQATNEELLSSNEELQSTNEELQSVNEELITLNAEYQEKINQLTEVNDDMSNFLNNIDVGLIFLDADLMVRKFTPSVSRVINLIENDIGRSITHISDNLVDVNLVVESQNVIKSLIPYEEEVITSDESIFILKIHPYRTSKNVINGVVITMVDITQNKRMQQRINNFVDEKHQRGFILVVTDKLGTVKYVNHYFSQVTGYSADQIIGKNVSELRSELNDQSLYDKLWQTILGGDDWLGKFYNRRADGSIYREIANIFPLHSKEGEINRFIKIAEIIEEKSHGQPREDA